MSSKLESSLARRFVFLVQVSRPIVWPVLPLVYALGLHTAHAHWSAAAIVQALTLTFPMNLFGCGLNDIYDYESDRRSPRRRAVWGAVVSADEQPFVLQACLSMTPLIFLVSCSTRNVENLMATISLVTIACIYSVPPYRLKERPPLDSLANGLGYFLFPLMMGYSFGANPRTMPPRFYLLALCVAGIHALASAADFDADQAAGHRTLAVKYGKRSAAALAFSAFFATSYFGEFGSVSVRAYLIVCTIATFAAAVVPHPRVIAAACVAIFAGFIAAAAAHLAGL